MEMRKIVALVLIVSALYLCRKLANWLDKKEEYLPKKSLND